MDNTVFDFIKDFLWAPLLALVAFAWNKNDGDHKDMQKEQAALRDAQSTGASKLNDRIMDHIDDQVRDLRVFVIAEDAKLMAENGVVRGHVAKIFDKLEAQAIRSDDRHAEVMKAIHDVSTTMHQALSKKADR